MLSFNRKKHQEFEVLVKPHLDALFRLAFRLTGSRDQSEDLVQETVVKIYERQHELAALQRPGAWLAKVLYNLFVDIRRREKRSPVSLVADLTGDSAQVISLDSFPMEQRSPEQDIDQGQFTHKLVHALEQLSEEQRVALMLYEVEGYSLTEIEQITDVPVGTLKSRLHRARNQLKTLFDQGTDDGLASCREVGEQQ